MQKRVFAKTVLALAALGCSLNLQAKDNSITVVTSFPKDLTAIYKAAFEKKFPGTKVEILNKSTSSGVKYLQEIRAKNTADIFWASAPDAFEVLKGDQLLQKYSSKATGIAPRVGAYPTSDPQGYYTGFAASGYGIMWNTRYVEAKKLPVAKEWADLKDPVYFGHVGISSPSRSGTTHLTIETVLQGLGWERGWAEWKEISGNLKTVTERSFGVPDGVNSGQFGYGIVIDFFGLSSKASGFPVDFVYPLVTAVVPANVGVVANAPNAKLAKQFVDYLLSPEGQELLLDPKIRRLPVRGDTYAKAPAGYPNPLTDPTIGSAVKFDLQVSKNRYNVVSALFDVMITYRLDELRAAVRSIQLADQALAKNPNAQAQKLVAEARRLVAHVPVTAEMAGQKDFNSIFTAKRKKASDKAQGRQAEIEQQWDKTIKENYTKAKELADKAKSML
jgi:phosphoglycerate transport regulatory protein PgtC